MAVESVKIAKHVHLDQKGREKRRLGWYDVRVHLLVSGRDVVTVPVVVNISIVMWNAIITRK